MSKIIQQMRDTVSAMNETIAQLTSTQAAVPSALGEGFAAGGVAVGVDHRHAKPGDTVHVWAASDRKFIGGQAAHVVADFSAKLADADPVLTGQIDARDTIPAEAYSKLVDTFGAGTQTYAPAPLPCMCCAEKGRQHVSSADRLPDEVAPSDTLVKTLREAIFRTEDAFSGEDGWEALSRRVLLALAHYEADSEVF